MNPLERFQQLLRDLFQFDLSDLDFGIYRLLRLKRDEVESFLTEQLPRAVGQAFECMAASERTALDGRAAELAATIRREIGEYEQTRARDLSARAISTTGCDLLPASTCWLGGLTLNLQ